MLGTYASAAFVCVGALVLGQEILRLCGASRWSWLAAPVGLAAVILIAIPSLHMPGRCTTVAIVLFVLVAAGGVHLLLTPEHRPPAVGLLAGVPVALLTAVPFAAAGHAGTLGWSFDNDMASHLSFADAYRSAVVERFHPAWPDYPLGPHALVAVVAQGLGIGVDEAFAGLTIAGALLLGWTALHALRNPRWWGPFVAVPLVGMPFLVAAYYGQGSFKELLEGTFVLGFALLLTFPWQLDRLWRWAPAAAILAGAIAVYSFQGLAWPLAFLGAWLAAAAVRELLATGSPQAVLRRTRASVVPAGLGAGVLVLLLVPQVPRLASFISNRSGLSAGIAKNDIGNLARRLPAWEAFGTWGNADYRFPAPDHLANRLWIAFVASLVVAGAIWAVRRREWMPVAAAGAAVAIWVVSDRLQSPYVAAKGLVILSPLLMLVAVRMLVEPGEPGRGALRWRWWSLVAPAIAVVLLIRVGDSSWNALRQSMVGPSDHMNELRALQPVLHHEPTLFLGNDDFIKWELGETPVTAPFIGKRVMSMRPQKAWTYGMDYDIDSLASATLNRYEWIIAPRDAAASAPPEQLRLVRRTRSFVLYRRAGTIPPSDILPEGPNAAAPLDCRTRQARALVRAGGVATIRSASVAAPVPLLAPGAAVTVRLVLRPGSWDLVVPYVGPRAIDVVGSGLRTTLPANLDRPGPRWPVGRLVVRRPGTVALTFRARTNRWVSPSAVTVLGSLIAVPARPIRTVPIADACGKLVDHYRTRAA